MKKFACYLIFTVLMSIITIAALAQGQIITPPTGSEWQELLTAIGGISGAGTMGIVFVVVKALALGFRTQLGKFAGVWQLIAVNGLMFVLGVLGSAVNGTGLVAALLTGANLALLSLFGNQLFKQIIKKDEDVKKIATNS